MLILRKALLHDSLYIVILFISILYFVIATIFTTYKSNYKPNETNFKGTVSNIVIEGDKLSFILKDKEKIKCNYYMQTIEEKTYFANNLKEGYVVEVNGVLEEPINNTIPNTFNYKKHLYNKKIYFILNIEEIKITSNKTNIFYKIKNNLKDKMLKNNNKAYLLTFIIGDKNLIDDDVFSNYQTLGVTHLFAISGMHISLFSTFLLFILKKMKVTENKRYIITILFLFFYAFLTNFSASVLRATIFFSLLSINKIYYTNIKTINIFLLTISILILINPFILYDLGAQYSIITSGGLILCMEKLQSKNYILNLIKVSVVAFLFSLPITAINFYEVNIFSIINNLVFVPYVSIIVYPFTLITFLFPFLNPILNILINFMEVLSNIFSSCTLYYNIPKSNSFLWIIFYVVLILMTKNSNKKYIIIILICLTLNRYKFLLDKNYYVYFLDVKQGDSIVLISPRHKEVMMIDTGGKLEYSSEHWQKKKKYQISNNTITFLKSIGIKKINTLILSHGDYDHAGEAVNIVNKLSIENIIFNNNDYNQLEETIINLLNKKNINYYKNIEEINFANNKLFFLNTVPYNNENEDSIVIFLELNNIKFLFMGDAGIKREQDIINKYNLKEIDIFKVGHHGSSTSSSQELINAIKPKYSIISVGKNNKYNHPKDSVLNILASSKIYRTDKNGTILLKIKDNKLNIKTYLP